MPRSRAWRMVAMDSESSCGPHPKDHPPPPTAQEPNPTVVILSPLEPSGRVGSAMVFSFFNRIDQILPMKYPEILSIVHSRWNRGNAILLADTTDPIRHRSP